MKQAILLVLFAALFALPWTGQAQTWQQSFDSHIQHWVMELANQDQRFHGFSEAAYTHRGLGPNSKQWLVTFRNKNKTLGYLIIQEANDSFHLLEYGLGEYTLFDEAMVHPFLSAQEKDLIPHYAGLASIWIGTQGIYDAKTGEKYPSTASVESIALESGVKAGTALLDIHHNEDSVLEEAWIRPGEKIESKEDLQIMLDTQPITFIGQLFQDTVTAPFKVIGYHIWGQGELFIELDDLGIRYVPFHHASKIGDFVK